jgi:hypothetical protein
MQSNFNADFCMCLFQSLQHVLNPSIANAQDWLLQKLHKPRRHTDRLPNYTNYLLRASDSIVLANPFRLDTSRIAL